MEQLKDLIPKNSLLKNTFITGNSFSLLLVTIKNQKNFLSINMSNIIRTLGPEPLVDFLNAADIKAVTARRSISKEHRIALRAELGAEFYFEGDLTKRIPEREVQWLKSNGVRYKHTGTGNIFYTNGFGGDVEPQPLIQIVYKQGIHTDSDENSHWFESLQLHVDEKFRAGAVTIPEGKWSFRALDASRPHQANIRRPLSLVIAGVLPTNMKLTEILAKKSVGTYARQQEAITPKMIYIPQSSHTEDTL
jgi:hypothetical protein